MTQRSCVCLFAPVCILGPSRAWPNGPWPRAHLGLWRPWARDPGQALRPRDSDQVGPGQGQRTQANGPGPRYPGRRLGSSNLGQVHGPILVGPRPWPKGPGPWLLSQNPTPKVASYPPAAHASNLGLCECVCVCEDTYLSRLSAYRPPPAIAKPIRKFASAEEPEKSENAPNQFHMASFGVVAGGLFSFGGIWAPWRAQGAK